MKVVTVIVALLSFAQSAGSATSLPASIRRQLDKHFLQWKFVVIESEIHQFVQERHGREARPDWIQGDFDSDGQTDYAVYVTHGKAQARKQSVVVLLKRGTDWRRFLLSSSPSEDPVPTITYLLRCNKGAKDYDYHRNKTFHYPHDAVFFGYFAKAGTSYVYRKGRFRAIVTSD